MAADKSDITNGLKGEKLAKLTGPSTKQAAEEVKARAEPIPVLYGSTSKERQTQFKKILKETILDVSLTIRSVSGYLYPVDLDSDFFKGTLTISEPGKYQGEFLSSTKVYQSLADDLQSGNGTDIALAQKILKSEYKIHLMPKPEYLLLVVEKLLKLWHSRPDLRDLTYSFKIQDADPMTIYKPDISHAIPLVMPGIVIYPSLGKKNAEVLLNAICDAFTLQETLKFGMGITPRFNTPINPLVYYAEGASDFKLLIKRAYRILTASLAHFRFGERLKIDALSSAAKIFVPYMKALSPKERALDKKESREELLIKALRNLSVPLNIELNPGTENIPYKHIRIFINTEMAKLAMIKTLAALNIPCVEASKRGKPLLIIPSSSLIQVENLEQKLFYMGQEQSHHNRLT